MKRHLDPMWPRPAQHAPVRSSAEMAAELRISAKQFGAICRWDAKAPKPTLVADNGRRRWYSPDEVRDWWKRRNAAVSGRGAEESDAERGADPASA